MALLIFRAQNYTSSQNIGYVCYPIPPFRYDGLKDPVLVWSVLFWTLFESEMRHNIGLHRDIILIFLRNYRINYLWIGPLYRFLFQKVGSGSRSVVDPDAANWFGSATLTILDRFRIIIQFRIHDKTAMKNWKGVWLKLGLCKILKLKFCLIPTWLDIFNNCEKRELSKFNTVQIFT